MSHVNELFNNICQINGETTSYENLIKNQNLKIRMI